jgi:DNA-binding transcriptional MocR family regulator
VSRPTRTDAGGRAYLDLQTLARRQGRPTQALLVMYVLERFLARLAAGPHAEQFILKGGMLLAAWQARRATVDADLLARGLSVDPEQVLATVSAIAAVSAPIESFMNDHRDEHTPWYFALMARFVGGVAFDENATADARHRISTFFHHHLTA